jgi:hypothetical protein
MNNSSSTIQFEYEFKAGRKAVVVAIFAAHDRGRAVLFAFLSPIDSTVRRVKFVIFATDPKHVLFAHTHSDEQMLDYAAKRFLDKKWGDLLSRPMPQGEAIPVEAILGP